MRKILIGSHAVKHWFSDYRQPKDKDYLVQDNTHIQNTPKVQYYEIEPLYDYLESFIKIPKPDILYTLKVSHSFWDIHWHKTMSDIIFLKSKGCKLIEPLFTQLYQHWENKHGEKKVNLNQQTEKFFNKHVERKYDHDSLHEIMAYYEEPMFKKLLVHPDKPLLSKKKFNTLSFEDKLKTVREEAYVIALERYVIPKNTGELVAYKRSIKDIVTRLSKGWFPRFIVENYKHFERPEIKYTEVFKQHI